MNDINLSVMKNIYKQALGMIVFLFSLFIGVVFVSAAPTQSFDCTYYIPPIEENGRNDFVALYAQLGSPKDMPKLKITYNYKNDKDWQTAIKNKNLTIQLEIGKDKYFGSDVGSGYKLSYNNVLLQFNYSDFPFDSSNGCPTSIWYKYTYDAEYGYTNVFSKEGSNKNLSLTVDLPTQVPDKAEVEIPEPTPEQKEQIDNTKYCKFLYNVTDHIYNMSADPVNIPLSICVRKRPNSNGYEYAVNEIGNECENRTGYSRPVDGTINYNTLKEWDNVGGLNIPIDMNGIEKDVKEENGVLICPEDMQFDRIGGDIKVDYSEIRMLNGLAFNALIEELQPYLVNHARIQNFNMSQYSNITVDGKDLAFPWVAASNSVLSLDEEVEYVMDQKLASVQSYCNELYSKYKQHMKNPEMQENFVKRLDECTSFNKFYNKGIEDGLLNNLGKNCGLLSNDMIDKLQWVLNLFRIIAPIAAIGLGTVDFVKVIASGDADKEMKNAGKRLGYRLIAAILLFLIPTILAFILDVFLGNNDGYNSDNPFCNVVEWKATE